MNLDPFGGCFSGTLNSNNVIFCAPYPPRPALSTLLANTPVALVEMLFTTSLVAQVRADSLRRLILTNTKRQTVICELLFVAP